MTSFIHSGLSLITILALMVTPFSYTMPTMVFAQDADITQTDEVDAPEEESITEKEKSPEEKESEDQVEAEVTEETKEEESTAVSTSVNTTTSDKKDTKEENETDPESEQGAEDDPVNTDTLEVVEPLTVENSDQDKDVTLETIEENDDLESSSARTLSDEVSAVALQLSSESFADICLEPKTEGESDPEKIKSSGEKTLQKILDDEIGGINAEDDQREYQVWEKDADTTVTLEFTFIEKIAHYDHVFGYYLDGDVSTFEPLFRAGAHSEYMPLVEFERGQSGTVSIADGEEIAFGIEVEKSNGGTHFLSTENAKNPNNKDQTVVFTPSDSTYVIAFEDQINGSDRDFNDMVVSIETIDCEREIEEISCGPNETNLVKNGSFEEPQVNDPWNIFAEGETGLEWLVSWVRPDGAPKDVYIELHAGVNGWQAYEGNQYAELDSDWQGPGGAGQEDASTYVYQNLNTKAGESYEIKFAFSPRPGTKASDNTLEVVWEGNDDYTVSPQAGGSENDWQIFSVPVTATANGSEVGFRDLGTGNSLGTFIDDIHVCGVEYVEPEEPELCTVENSPWGYEVVEGSFVQGDTHQGIAVDANRSVTDNALGVAEDDDTLNFVSLGIGGEIVIKFEAPFPDKPGDDIQIFETTFGDRTYDEYPEDADVFVSQDGVTWYEIGSVQTNGGTLDINGVLEWAQYVKIVDTTDGSKINSNDPIDGFDLDGIKVLHCDRQGEEPQQPYGEITFPSEEGQILGLGTTTLTATYNDHDDLDDDEVQWAVREGFTCAPGVDTVAGNVDGFEDEYTLWDGKDFAADVNLPVGDYCFVFNPTEDEGEDDVRETRTFTIKDDGGSNPGDLTPSVTLEADTLGVTEDTNTDVELTWTTTSGDNPVTCEIDNGVGAGLDANGTTTVVVNTTTTFTITCTDVDNDSTTDSVTIEATSDDGGSNGSGNSPSSGGGSVTGGFVGGQGGGSVLGDSTGQVLGTSCGLYLTEYIHADSPNNNRMEVVKLQAFLNTFIGSNLNIDGTFDSDTYEAVHTFQRAYAGGVITPWVQAGHLQPGESTGYVYKTTKRQINMIMCPELGLPIPDGLKPDTDVTDQV